MVQCTLHKLYNRVHYLTRGILLDKGVDTSVDEGRVRYFNEGSTMTVPKAGDSSTIATDHCEVSTVGSHDRLVI